MAELLTKIPTNLTEYPNSFKRQGAFPLEAYSVFYATEDKTAFEAAQDYATNNGIAYVGQTLAVVTANAEDSAVVDDVTFYIIADAAGTLQEVGKATNGDNNSITLTDGVLSLKGFEAAPNATLPQKAPVYKMDGEDFVTDDQGNKIIDHYELHWVTIDSIVEGDGNTKAVVAAGDNETHVIIETVRNDETDTNTYKISLDLSAYATNVTVGNAIDAAKQDLQDKIDAEKSAREAAIGVASAPASTEHPEGVKASGIHAVIEAGDAALETKIADVLAEAKQYTDDNVYNDEALSERVKAVEDTVSDHGTRIGVLETAIGSEASGLIKDLADEAAAREQGDEKALDDAKAYTDDEIEGLEIIIEKKTVENIESDYIVIKNKAGTEVASVNAAKFVKDGMLDSAVYSTETKKLTLTWNTDSDKENSVTELDLNDLVNTYTGSEHIVVGTDGVISVKDTVALKTDLTSLKTTIDGELAAEVETLEAANTAIGERIDGVVADVALKAVKSEVDAALADKADKSAFDTHVETYNEFVESYAADKETFATTTDLDNKVDTTTYENDKETFATKTDVSGQFAAAGQRIGLVEEAIGKEAEGDDAATGLYKKIGDLGVDVATNYATKTEVAGVDAKTGSNTTLITNLSKRIDDIVAEGGEPNTINNIKVNGVAQTIAEDKSVNITVPVISDTKISQLNDGQALLNDVDKAKADIITLGGSINGAHTNVAGLITRIAALETEVRIEGESRIDALEGTLNGVEGTSTGLIGTTATLVSDVAGLKTEDNRLAALIQATDAKFANYQTKADAETAHKALSDDITSLNSTFTAYVQSQETTIAALATKTELANKADKTELDSYYTKTVADETFVKSADFNNKVDARVNTLIDGANSEDTITNITNLIEFVNENASDIAQLITDVDTNTATIAEHSEKIQINTNSITALTTTVAAQKVIDSDEITASTVEGGVQLSVKKVNVNTLVQTTGEVLILNGGSATVSTTEA